MYTLKVQFICFCLLQFYAENQCQITAELILKSDNIAKSGKELKRMQTGFKFNKGYLYFHFIHRLGTFVIYFFTVSGSY